MSTTVQRVLSEDLLTLAQARNEIPWPEGRPARETLYRWTQRGCGGVRLESVRIGSQILTSRQALTRFIEARSERRAACA